MYLTSVRLRWACNSSSTHSAILFRSPPTPVTPLDGYGWDNFTLVTREDKLKYISAQLFHAVGEEHYKRISREVFPELIAWKDEKDVPSVDSQSQWRVGVGDDIVAHVLRLLLRPDVGIIGGNDNFESHPDLRSPNVLAHLGRDPFEALGRLTRYSHARKEWTLLHVKTGAKIRIATEDAQDAKPEAPELVDMKITDFCAYGCSYCYQGSTREGKDVPAEEIVAAWKRLEAEGVLEVALGGGEPTLHKEWEALAEYIDTSKMRFAITTRNFAWHPTILPRRLSVAGSVDSVEDTQRFLVATARKYPALFRVARRDETEEEASLQDAIEDPARRNPVTSFLESCGSWPLHKLWMRGGHNRFSIQIVVGAHPEHVLRGIVQVCKEANLPLTLLGWKATGRAQGQEPMYTVDWAKVIRDEGMNMVGVDTALVQRHRTLFQERVPAMLYHTDEGKFSAALSWSKGQWYLSPSSYSSTRVAIDVRDQDAWKRAWLSLPIEG